VEQPSAVFSQKKLFARSAIVRSESASDVALLSLAPIDAAAGASGEVE
jgi:hypothetical protein